MNPFDLCGDLPTGTTVLEASAGTGKTHTVGALVARYVAEGHAKLHELLVVTFGRAASQELRERVRGQLVAAERGLADPAGARAGDDELLRLLAAVDDADVVVRRRRLATALADFDSATIATTHQFCQQVLTGLGVAGDTVAPDFRFHLQIAQSTGNPYFADIMSHLGTTIIPRTRISALRNQERGGSYLSRVNREHEEIYAAIARRDAESARAAMRIHLTNSRERLRAAQEAARVAGDTPAAATSKN